LAEYLKLAVLNGRSNLFRYFFNLKCTDARYLEMALIYTALNNNDDDIRWLIKYIDAGNERHLNVINHVIKILTGKNNFDIIYELLRKYRSDSALLHQLIDESIDAPVEILMMYYEYCKYPEWLFDKVIHRMDFIDSLLSSVNLSNKELVHLASLAVINDNDILLKKLDNYRKLESYVDLDLLLLKCYQYNIESATAEYLFSRGAILERAVINTITMLNDQYYFSDYLQYLTPLRNVIDFYFYPELIANLANDDPEIINFVNNLIKR
jgi:hypothetical protein